MSRYTFFSDSDPAATQLELEGVWLHLPSNPAATVRQYRFGKAARSSSIEIGGTVMVFAGRRWPVTEYGEHQEDEYSINVQIPNGETYRADLDGLRQFAEAKTAMVLRDNRGRAAHGTMAGYSEDDQEWGSEVSFTFHRVDVEETTL